MAVDNSAEIMRALGRLEEGVTRLRQDFSEEKISAAASRKGVYVRQDEFSEELAKLREENLIAAHISAQVREEVKTVNRSLESFKAEAQPPLEDFKRLRHMGYGIAALLTMLGISVGTLVALGIDWIKELLRQWLG